MSIPATIISEENELTIYCKITDFDGLSQAVQVLTQTQYEIKSPTGKGKIRVRSERDGRGLSTYTLTTKVKNEDKNVASNTEYTTIIDNEYFDAFKAIAGKGQSKDRYLFPVTKITADNTAADISKNESYFEVDIFADATGSRYVWCKIDLEIDSILELTDKSLTTDIDKVKITAKISNLPFKPVEAFTEETATEEQKKFISVLYDLWNA